MYTSNQPKPFHTQHKPVNFNGLTRDMKKIAYKNAPEIIKYVEKHPKSNGIVGSLPYEWVSRIPKENRKELVKEFYQNMKGVFLKGGKKVFGQGVEVDAYSLKQTFLKAGIISSGNDLDIGYKNYGGYGDVFKLRINNDKNEYALKVFKEDETKSFCGGNYVELNKAAYWQEQAGSKTDWTRFCFGDMNAGYMLNKLISKDTPVCKRKTPMYIYGLESEYETDKNIINGYNVDFGTMRITSDEMVRNKTARATCKKIYKSKPEQRIQVFEEYLKLNDENVNIGLINSLNKSLLSEEDIEKYFKILNDTKSIKVKKELFNHFIINNSSQTTRYYKELAHNADSESRKFLLSNLFIVSPKDRLKCYRLLAKGSDIKTRILLLQNSYGVDKNDNRFNCLWPLLIP